MGQLMSMITQITDVWELVVIISSASIIINNGIVTFIHGDGV